MKKNPIVNVNIENAIVSHRNRKGSFDVAHVCSGNSCTHGLILTWYYLCLQKNQMAINYYSDYPDTAFLENNM